MPNGFDTHPPSACRASVCVSRLLCCFPVFHTRPPSAVSDTLCAIAKVISSKKKLTMPKMSPHMISLRNCQRAAIATILVLCAACSGTSKDVQASEPDPSWVSSYKDTARAGCKCKTEACFTKAKTKLDAMVSEHGGFDEVPLSVHEAHKSFDPCWRAGTADLSRDIAKLADALCRCSEQSCVQQFRESLVRLEDKYGTNFEPSNRETLSSETRRELGRADECFTALSIPGEDYVAYMEETALAVCACGDLKCLHKVLLERRHNYEGKVFVDSLPAVQSKLELTNSRYCGCLGEGGAQELADKMQGGIPLKLNMPLRCGT